MGAAVAVSSPVFAAMAILDHLPLRFLTGSAPHRLQIGPEAAYFFLPDSRRCAMANREQRSNREKKKPKADKGLKQKPAAPTFVAPELVRKPHKGKEAG
ncbi:MAG: hypothetical protein JO261_04300 [Alphaproteobacteria bacterium]|nr:hypothetical protein [Alphaproteobacteria bacterium]MBV9692901.1 hypothetical protein [Alphaproteobacteria bacterium]